MAPGVEVENVEEDVGPEEAFSHRYTKVWC